MYFHLLFYVYARVDPWKQISVPVITHSCFTTWFCTRSTDGNVPLGTVDGEDEEFDEEEILGGDDMDAVDLGKLTPQEEAAALGVNISVRDVSR